MRIGAPRLLALLPNGKVNFGNAYSAIGFQRRCKTTADRATSISEIRSDGSGATIAARPPAPFNCAPVTDYEQGYFNALKELLEDAGVPVPVQSVQVSRQDIGAPFRRLAAAVKSPLSQSNLPIVFPTAFSGKIRGSEMPKTRVFTW